MSDHRATVVAIYEAFGGGNIPAVLDRLSEDVRWEHWAAWTPHAAGVPWLKPRQGRAGAGEFFQVIGGGTKAATAGNPQGRVRAILQPKPKDKPAAGAPVPLTPAEKLGTQPQSPGGSASR